MGGITEIATTAPGYTSLPLDDRRVERFEPHMAGRPTLVEGNSQTTG
jgi:arylsulfatase